MQSLLYLLFGIIGYVSSYHFPHSSYFSHAIAIRSSLQDNNNMNYPISLDDSMDESSESLDMRAIQSIIGDIPDGDNRRLYLDEFGEEVEEMSDNGPPPVDPTPLEKPLAVEPWDDPKIKAILKAQGINVNDLYMLRKQVVEGGDKYASLPSKKKVVHASSAPISTPTIPPKEKSVVSYKTYEDLDEDDDGFWNEMLKPAKPVQSAKHSSSTKQAIQEALQQPLNDAVAAISKKRLAEKVPKEPLNDVFSKKRVAEKAHKEPTIDAVAAISKKKVIEKVPEENDLWPLDALMSGASLPKTVPKKTEKSIIDSKQKEIEQTLFDLLREEEEEEPVKPIKKATSSAKKVSKKAVADEEEAEPTQPVKKTVSSSKKASKVVDEVKDEPAEVVPQSPKKATKKTVQTSPESVEAKAPATTRAKKSASKIEIEESEGEEVSIKATTAKKTKKVAKVAPEEASEPVVEMEDKPKAKTSRAKKTAVSEEGVEKEEKPARKSKKSA